MKEKTPKELDWDHLTTMFPSAVKKKDAEMDRLIKEAQKIHDDLLLVQARHAHKPMYTGMVSISAMAGDSAEMIHKLINLVMFLASPTYVIEVELPRPYRWE